MAKKKQTTLRYSLKWAKSFCAEVAKGRTTKDIVEAWYPLKSPAYATVWAWKSKYGEFHDLMTQAYESKIMIWTDELETLSKETTPHFQTPAEYASYRDDRKCRIQALQFNLAKLAPLLHADYSQRTKVDVSGDAGPQIVVTSYATPASVTVIKPKRGK